MGLSKKKKNNNMSLELCLIFNKGKPPSWIPLLFQPPFLIYVTKSSDSPRKIFRLATKDPFNNFLKLALRFPKEPHYF